MRGSLDDQFRELVEPRQEFVALLRAQHEHDALDAELAVARDELGAAAARCTS